MTASESAREFAALSASEKSQKIADTRAMLKDKCGNSYLRSTISNFSVDLLLAGRVEDFEELGSDFLTVWKLWEKGVDLDTGFALVALDPNLEPLRFEVARDRDFQNFQQTYTRFTEIFRNAGSDEFIWSLYKYSVRYGGLTGESNQPIKDSQCDLFLPYAAVILMRKHGEDKVIELLDRMTKEAPLPVLAFIRLVETDHDFQDITLSWAAEIVSSND